jgi:small subunit ribosomal protein S20
VAVHKAAKKSVRQDEKARKSNRIWKSKVKSAKKKLENALEKNERDTFESLFQNYVRVVDRAFSKGVIHKNNAARKKTRMAQRLAGAGTSK